MPRQGRDMDGQPWLGPVRITHPGMCLLGYIRARWVRHIDQARLRYGRTPMAWARKTHPPRHVFDRIYPSRVGKTHPQARRRFGRTTMGRPGKTHPQLRRWVGRTTMGRNSRDLVGQPWAGPERHTHPGMAGI